MFNPFAARCVERLVAGGLTGRVVEFGNQRFGARGVIHGDGHIKTTEEFYKWLGFKEYVALDVNTDMGAAIVDLNEPILFTEDRRLSEGKDPFGQFDLVTNNGTGEHIFDQAMVFKNAHYLCLRGGVMLHVLPFSPWINHGFYNFNPILFRDLAAANGYELLSIVIDNRDGGKNEIPKVDWPYLFVEKQPSQLLKLMKMISDLRQGDLILGVALRKTTDAPFRKPLQGKYQGDVKSKDLRDKYQTRGGI
jgi:hypothetical protein